MTTQPQQEEWVKECKDALRMTVQKTNGVPDLRDLKGAQKTFDDIVELQWKILGPRIRQAIATVKKEARAEVFEEVLAALPYKIENEYTRGLHRSYNYALGEIRTLITNLKEKEI